MSLLERFRREKGGAMVAIPAGYCLVWGGGTAIACLPDELEETLAEILNISSEAWLADLGYKRDTVGRYTRGLFAVLPSMTRDEVRLATVKQMALHADPNWDCPTPGIWVAKRGRDQHVYNALDDTLTSTISTRNPPLDQLCS